MITIPRVKKRRAPNKVCW